MKHLQASRLVVLYITLTLPTKLFCPYPRPRVWPGGLSIAIGIDQKSYPCNYNTIVSFVPRQAGIYVLFNRPGFQVGAADDLVDRRLQFLLGKESTINGRQPSTFQFEVVIGDEQRKARMNQLSTNFQISGSKERDR